MMMRIKVQENSLDGILFNGGVLANFSEPDSGIWEVVIILIFAHLETLCTEHQSPAIIGAAQSLALPLLVTC